MFWTLLLGWPPGESEEEDDDDDPLGDEIQVSIENSEDEDMDMNNHINFDHEPSVDDCILTALGRAQDWMGSLIMYLVCLQINIQYLILMRQFADQVS